MDLSDTQTPERRLRPRRAEPPPVERVGRTSPVHAPSVDDMIDEIANELVSKLLAIRGTPYMYGVLGLLVPYIVPNALWLVLASAFGYPIVFLGVHQREKFESILLRASYKQQQMIALFVCVFILSTVGTLFLALR